MKYYINSDTKKDIFYHGSKEGIVGKIEPKSEKATDFGDGFYMGTKEIQTLSRITSNPNAKAYQFKISDDCINDENTIVLTNDDWMYFVLYNRGKLEDIKDTAFYKKYEHLADDKDFIIGAIADDVYDACIKDFTRNLITDWTFKQLIDCFDYGTQIVAKSQKACDSLITVSEKALTKEDRKDILNKQKMTKSERFEYYNQKVAQLNAERKGLYLNEIKDKIRKQEKENKLEQIDITNMIDTSNEKSSFKNIKFPSKIHSKGNVEYGLFE